MADIDVVPKRRSAMSVWVLLALVVLAVLLVIGLAGRADESTMFQQFHAEPVF
jgi:hypothetical protein